MQRSRFIVLLRLTCLACSLSTASAAVTLNITDFDPACGQTQHNCRSAFQKAFDAVEKAGAGTVNLSAGTFFIDFPEVSNDVTSGAPLQKGSLISVPSNVTIRGSPDTTIEWKTTSIP